jgi:hypothetical protein
MIASVLDHTWDVLALWLIGIPVIVLTVRSEIGMKLIFVAEGPMGIAACIGVGWLLAKGNHPLIAGLLTAPALVWMFIGCCMTVTQLKYWNH